MIFSKEEIKAFEMKAGEYNSSEELLVGLNAIKYRGEERFVVEYEGLKGTADPVTGIIFTTDIPYTLYSELIEALGKKARKKNYAEKMKLQELDEKR